MFLSATSPVIVSVVHVQVLNPFSNILPYFFLSGSSIAKEVRRLLCWLRGSEKMSVVGFFGGGEYVGVHKWSKC